MKSEDSRKDSVPIIVETEEEESVVTKEKTIDRTQSALDSLSMKKMPKR